MKTRAVAYCRVSTDHDDQINSLENQRRYWEEYIKSRIDMEFRGLYVDEGITGTSIIKRDGFNSMIYDASKGSFDLILTKEVSRFGRNIVDVLQSTRKLKSWDVGVYFESDNISTMDNDGELRLSIMATLAQEESRKISERVKWGHKRSMKNGVVYGADRVLGYDLKDKKLTINEKEAEIVKKIFQWYLEGETLHGIVRRLGDMGVTEGKMGGKLTHSSIRQILSNEKYCGDLKQSKHYTIDHLTHKTKKNKGEKEFIVISDNHPAIISREKWNKAQQSVNKRQEMLAKDKSRHTTQVWGNRIICGDCGSKYRRRVLKNKDGSGRPVWKCAISYNLGKKGCPNGSYIREDVLELITMEAFQKLAQLPPDFLNEFVETLNKSVNEEASNQVRKSNIIKQVEKADKVKKKLIDLYLDDDISVSKEQLNVKLKEQNGKVEELNRLLHDIDNREHGLKSDKERITCFYRFIYEQRPFEIFDEAFVKEYVEKLEIHNAKKQVKVFMFMGQYDADLTKYPLRVNSRDHSSR